MDTSHDGNEHQNTLSTSHYQFSYFVGSNINGHDGVWISKTTVTKSSLNHFKGNLFLGLEFHFYIYEYKSHGYVDILSLSVFSDL